MGTTNEKYIGYIRYCGALVDNGLMDARKSAQALLGFDEAIRFYVGYQNKNLEKHDFELPVRIRQGSWEALIPDSIFWLKTIGGIVATAYLAKAAQTMAKNDFEDIGIKEIFIKSLEAIQWMVKIGKHLGTITIKEFEHVKFRKNNTEIAIQNNKGKYLWVPHEYLEMFTKSPKSILDKLAGVVEEERILTIGGIIENKEKKETITDKDKYIFVSQEDEDVLFPELKHGMVVDLEGEVTRGNETTNSIGFRYNGHILTAYPQEGSIVSYKPALFLKARIHGIIDRTDEKGRIAAKRPKIIFTDIIPKKVIYGYNQL